jgi:23S rRNA (cytidine1920-2'-O)/16S rRNA (cytidine1409-2'-O)-methyltransferase
MKRERIDKLLIEYGFAESLAKARALIMSGVVLADEQRIGKASESVSITSKIRIKGDSPESKYVGRGGLKLEKALRAFHIRVSEYVCLDIGSSTGGFTDCLLQNGARMVVAVDAGINQLDWKLRADPRVEVRENCNARFLKPVDFPLKFDLIVMDVSFISATKIFAALSSLLKNQGKLITLIKPQFEVARNEVEKGGIVRDAAKHARVIAEVNQSALENGLKNLHVIDSPILGAEGNKEFLALYEGN